MGIQVWNGLIGLTPGRVLTPVGAFLKQKPFQHLETFHTPLTALWTFLPAFLMRLGFYYSGSIYYATGNVFNISRSVYIATGSISKASHYVVMPVGAFLKPQMSFEYLNSSTLNAFGCVINISEGVFKTNCFQRLWRCLYCKRLHFKSLWLRF